MKRKDLQIKTTCKICLAQITADITEDREPICAECQNDERGYDHE